MSVGYKMIDVFSELLILTAMGTNNILLFIKINGRFASEKQFFKKNSTVHKNSKR